MIKQAQLITGLIFLGLSLTGCSTNIGTANIDKTGQISESQPTETVNLGEDYALYISAGSGLSYFIENLNELKEGTDFYFLEYADANKIIIRNYAYIIVMESRNNSWEIDSALDLRPIGCTNTQGDFYTQVHVMQNGNTVYIQNSSTEDGRLPPLYEYDTEQHILMKAENAQIPAYEPSGVSVWDGSEKTYETPDGYEYKIIYELDKWVLVVLNGDDSIGRKIEMENGNIELGYAGNGVAVQIAYPDGQDETLPFWSNCRLIYYDLTTGETKEQRIGESVGEKAAEETVLEAPVDPGGNTVLERFDVPTGFKRVEPTAGSFAHYLQRLPLKPIDAKVKYFDGREKTNDVYLSVVDFSLGDRDLQQCADAVMRLRAEYLYENNRFDEIHFNFVNGFNAEFSKWAAGNAISVNGNKASWAARSGNNSSYESFQRYLDVVYAYASSISLEKELAAKPLSGLAIGDVFIQGGSPGHCVIVVDMAVNETTGEKIFMLAQSYMPAQDIQILKGDTDGSPWFSANIENTLRTPEWTFNSTDLKTWQ